MRAFAQRARSIICCGRFIRAASQIRVIQFIPVRAVAPAARSPRPCRRGIGCRRCRAGHVRRVRRRCVIRHLIIRAGAAHAKVIRYVYRRACRNCRCDRAVRCHGHCHRVGHVIAAVANIRDCRACADKRHVGEIAKARHRFAELHRKINRAGVRRISLAACLINLDRRRGRVNDDVSIITKRIHLARHWQRQIRTFPCCGILDCSSVQG